MPIAGVLGLVAAVAAIAFAGPPTPPPGRANLYGKVNDAATGEPISGVLVTLNGLEVSTDAGGNYIFEDLEPGAYEGSASREGYETAYF
ncbi:hypothetical protein ES705_44996 [subsurface metagenome]